MRPALLIPLLAVLLLCNASLLRAQGEEKTESLAADAYPTPGKRYWEAAASAMSEVLARMNNYTCLLHMSRYEQGRREIVLRKADTVRLQVAALGGSEYYALPGSTASFTNPRKLIATGMIGTGIFQGYAHSIFVTRGLQKLEFLGADGDGSHPLMRFRFTMDPVHERLKIALGSRSALAPAKGEFWLDQKDLLLRRVVVENASPILRIGVRRALYMMDWAPVKTRTGKFLLPQHAEIWMFLSDGGIHRNDITLAQCREYQAESSIRFDLEEEDYTARENVDGAVPGIAAASFLPPGVTLELQLSEALDFSVLNVGDTFRTTLTKPAQHRGRTLLPRGAVVEGRLRRFEHFSKPRPHTVVWLEFPFLRDGAQEFTFLADLIKRDALPGLVDEISGTARMPSSRGAKENGYDSLGSAEPGYRSVPGVGSFIFTAEDPHIPAGYTMEWKSIAATP